MPQSSWKFKLKLERMYGGKVRFPALIYIQSQADDLTCDSIFQLIPFNP